MSEKHIIHTITTCSTIGELRIALANTGYVDTTPVFFNNTEDPIDVHDVWDISIGCAIELRPGPTPDDE